MSRSAKLNRVADQDPESEADRRLELAAEIIARIAVRIASAGAKEQPISNADEQQAA